MRTEKLTRREWLRHGSGAAAAAALASSALGQEYRIEGADIKLGIASYSFRKFSREQAIQMTKELGEHAFHRFHTNQEDVLIRKAYNDTKTSYMSIIAVVCRDTDKDILWTKSVAYTHAHVTESTLVSSANGYVHFTTNSYTYHNSQHCALLMDNNIQILNLHALS